ncbi:MAG: hypothetical protein EAZ20_08790 [Bacteroidetes bacterium]|nr:MAG: hypothetical protein EAZ20_08790 [Bacteroidota bacterium]
MNNLDGIFDDVSDEEPQEIIAPSYTEKSLEQLSKKELMDIILKSTNSSSSSFIKPITIIDSVDAQKIFDKLKKQIDNLLSDDDILYQPEKFEIKLQKYLDAAKPLFHSEILTDLTDYLLRLIKTIENLLEEGYLYVEGGWGSSEEYFEGNEFGEFTLEAVKHLDTEDKLAWKKEFDKIEFGYSGFETIEDKMLTIFDDEEMNTVKKDCFEQLKQTKNELTFNTLLYFDFLNRFFTDEEKGFYLEETYSDSPKLLAYYCEFLGDNIEKIIEVKFNYFTNTISYINSLKELIILLEKHKKNNLLAKIPAILIEKDKNYTLIQKNDLPYLISKFPSHQKEFELRVKTSHLTEYFDYLSENNRLEECLQILDNYNSSQRNDMFRLNFDLFKFFSKYKNQISDRASAYFLEIIKKNKDSADNSSYEAFVKSLVQLRTLNSLLAKQLADEARTKYKNRRNLIALLNREKF